MTGDTELLIDIQESKGETMTFGNDDIVEILGIGKVASFSTNQNPTQTFPSGNMFLVLVMSRNPFSISQLDKG